MTMAPVKWTPPLPLGNPLEPSKMTVWTTAKAMVRGLGRVSAWAELLWVMTGRPRTTMTITLHNIRQEERSWQ